MVFLVSSCKVEDRPFIEVFAGSACKPALDQIASSYKRETGIEVRLIYGGSGSVLSNMIISGRGDLFIPGSNDFMDMAFEKGVADKGSLKILAYLVPVIAVQKGNPEGIGDIKDLLRPDVSFAIGDPRSVCAGLYAAEIFERAGILPEARQSVLTYAESCEKTATLIAVKAVDAVIGWDVFEKWNSDEVDIVEIDRKYLVRAAYIPAAIVKHSQKKEMADGFLQYISSVKGRDVFAELGYIVSERDLKSRYGSILTGGRYILNDLWR